MSKYLTAQGDMWDIVSLRVYGNEMLMHKLIEANPFYRNIVVFPANCELLIPEIAKEEKSTFPPWRRRKI